MPNREIEPTGVVTGYSAIKERVLFILLEVRNKDRVPKVDLGGEIYDAEEVDEIWLRGDLSEEERDRFNQK